MTMTVVLVVILALVTLAMIGAILLQKSEGGGLTGGGSAMSGVMSARGAANFLTRTTAVLAALFMGICIVLSIQSNMSRRPKETSAFDAVPVTPAPASSPSVPVRSS